MTAFLWLMGGFTLGFLVAACFQVGAVADGWEESRRERRELEAMWNARR